MARSPRRMISALAVLPIVCSASLTLSGAVDVPWGDDWSLGPAMVRAHDGHLSWADLWAQHNEHRLLIPRVVMIALGLLTGWDLRAQMLASALCAVATFALLLRRAGETARSQGEPLSPWAAPLLAMITFSFTQWHNWIWGWQLQIFLCVLATVAGLGLLAAPAPGWRRVSLAGLMGFVATTSFAAGFAFWPAGALVLAARPRADGTPWFRDRALVGWGLMTVAMLACYLSGYERAPGASRALPDASLVARYLPAFLGAPLSPTASIPEDAPFRALGLPALPLAIVLGVAGVVALAARAHALARGTSPEHRPTIAFWAALGLFALLVAGMCSVGRVAHGGPAQALQSRYVTLASLLWSALVVLLLVRAPGEERGSPRRGAAGAGAAAIGVLCALGTYSTAPIAVHWRTARLDSAARLRAGDPAALERLSPLHTPAEIAAVVSDLRQRRLTLFRRR